MRFWYVGNKREHLLNKPTIALFAATLAVLLVWLLPRDSQFRDMLAKPQSDMVALRYGELMAERSPSDHEVTYLLAFQYFNLGRLQAALEVLRRIPMVVADARTRMLQAEILEHLYFATDDQTRKRELAQALTEVLMTFNNDPDLKPEQRRRIARLALAFEQPAVAAAQYAWFAAHGDLDDLLAAGRVSLQAGDAERAAAFFTSAVDAELGGDSLSGALTAYRALDDFAPGIALIQRQLDKGAISPEAFFEVARFLQAAEAFAPLRRLIEQTEQVPFQGDDLLAWVDIAVAAGAVEAAARRIPELLAQHGDDPSQRLRVAQLYTWTDRAPEALDHWQWLSNNAPELANLTETLRLARLSYRYGAIIDLLTRSRKQRVLNEAERHQLIHAHLEVGDPQAAIDILEDHLRRDPTDRQSWNLGADILLADERFEQALQWWDRMSGSLPLEDADRLAIARTHWIRFEHGLALENYLAVDHDNLDDPEDYWQSVANLAWTLGDRPQTAAALTQLAELTELDARQYSQLISSLDGSDLDRRRFYAYDAWQRTGNPQYLLSALADSFDVDRSSFERMLAIARANAELFEDFSLYWMLLARHHQRNDDPTLARKAFDRALALSPRDPVTAEQALWFLVDAQDIERLPVFLQRFASLGLAVPRLANSLASGFALIGEYTLAAQWYARAYALKPEDPDLGLAYADALLASGRPDPAYRLRHHLLRQVLTSSDDLYTLQRASLGLLSTPQFNQLLPALTDANRGAIYDTLMSALLEERHLDGLQAVRALALANDEPVAPYVNFFLALSELDLDALEPFRNSTHAPTRAEALASLGQSGDALYTALNGIHDQAPVGDRVQLRRLATDLQFEDPYGAQALLTQQDLGGIDLTRSHLRFGQPLDAGHLDTRLTVSEFDPADALNETRRFEQTAFTTRYQRSSRNGSWSVTALAVSGDTNDWLGLEGDRLWRLDGKLDVSAHADVHSLAKQTAYLQMLGRRSSLGTGVTHRASNADTLVGRFDYHHFEDHWGAPIGQGGELQLNHEHALWFDAPSLRLVNSFYAFSATRETNFGSELDAVLRNVRPQDVLPESVQRVSTGLVLQRGEPEALNRRVASPHYRLGAFAGYQWPADGGFTFNLDASVGTQLLGRDMLRFGINYASQPLAGTGQSGLTWTINYSYRMGQ